MIERIRFKNFKALKEVELKLGSFNLIVGPNGSGKTSILQGFEAFARPGLFGQRPMATIGSETAGWSIDVRIAGMKDQEWVGIKMAGGQHRLFHLLGDKEMPTTPSTTRILETVFAEVKSVRVYAPEPSKMVHATDLRNVKELDRDGSNLSGTLTYIRDHDEDAYARLRDELNRWFPEFDGVGFTTDQNGYRQVTLRQAGSRKHILASEISEGSLLSLALLAILHQPSTPVLIGLEEPDRGIHPRTLRDVRDALYRLAFPSEFGLTRASVQVVVTTHSPYFLDLFREHPEQVIVTEKNKDGTAMARNLGDDQDLKQMIGDAPLGEVWYSGILGGVPRAK